MTVTSHFTERKMPTKGQRVAGVLLLGFEALSRLHSWHSGAPETALNA